MLLFCNTTPSFRRIATLFQGLNDACLPFSVALRPFLFFGTTIAIADYRNNFRKTLQNTKTNILIFIEKESIMKNATEAANVNETVAVEEPTVASNSNDFDAVESDIVSIPPPEIIEPKIPMGICIDRAEALCSRGNGDKEPLLKAGMPENALIKLQQATGAARHAQAQYMNVEDIKIQWQEESGEGFALLERLIHDMKFAYRNNPKVLAMITSATKRASIAEKIQQLANISAIGKANPEELKMIGNFDFSLLDKAEALSARLGNLHGDVENADNSARILRNQTYTFLHRCMKQVQEYGKYVFHDDKIRYRGYTGLFNRPNGKRKVKTEEVSETTETNETIAGQAS